MSEVNEQQLIFAHSTSTTNKRILNVGLDLKITNQLDSPFNLFLNFDQLIDDDKRYIYLFIYSMGEKKIAGWGVYDRVATTFELSGNCRYIGPQLYPMTMLWIKEGYKYIGNSVTNRPARLINKYLDQADKADKADWMQEDYIKSKYLLAYYNKDITEAEIELEYPGLLEQLPSDQDELIDYMIELGKKNKKFEETINRTDLNRSALALLKYDKIETLYDITTKFYQYVSKSKISGPGYEKLLQQCPYLDTCKIDSTTENCEVYHGYSHDDDIDFT